MEALFAAKFLLGEIDAPSILIELINKDKYFFLPLRIFFAPLTFFICHLGVLIMGKVNLFVRFVVLSIIFLTCLILRVIVLRSRKRLIGLGLEISLKISVQLES